MKRTTFALTASVLALGVVGYCGTRLWAQAAATVPATRPAVAEPRTRVALLNLAYVIKNYKKWEGFQAEIKANFKDFELKVQAKQKMMEDYAKQIQDPKSTATADQKEAYAKEITKLKREIEDINNEAKGYLGTKSDNQMVILYKEVQDAAQRYAVAHNYEMVLHYTDAVTQQDYYSPANIARKLQAGALMPLYATPGLDISQEVVIALNSAYRSSAATAPAPAGTGARPSGN